MSKIAEKKQINANKNKAHKQSNLNTIFLERFRLILLALLAIVVFYPPFLRGLYFESEQVPAEIFIFAIYIVFLIYKYLKQDKKFIKTPMEYVSIAFVVVYMASIFVSVGTREAISEWLKYCMFFAVFTMLSELLNTYKSKLMILWVIVSSALGVSIIGIDGIAGGKFASVLNNIFKALGASNNVFFGTFEGNRINSTFQYPNATAAYLMAVFFVTTALMMTSKKIYTKLVAGISSYIILITFMLTLSRGAMVFLPIVGILFIVLQPSGSKLRSVFSVVPAGIGMLLTLSKLSNIMASPEGNEANVWKYFVLGIIITAFVQVAIELADFFIRKIKEKNESFYSNLKRVSYFFFGAALIILAVGSVVAVTSKAPLILSHEAGQADSSKSVRRSFVLEPDKEYKLIYDVQSENMKDKPNSYSISIASRDFAGIINGKDTSIINVDGKATTGTEQRELIFKVPSNSRAVSITFINYYEDTKAEFKDAKVVPAENTGKEKKIALKYKYIPESIYARIDEAKETKSGIERTIFARDGFEIFKDHPILGGGGGSWQIENFVHQSYLYWSTQAHNYPVQVAVETGIVGLLILLGFWVAVVMQGFEAIRKRKSNNDSGVLKAGVLAGCLALIMHSVMDFDLSLSSIYLVLWELLAVINSGVLAEENTADGKLVDKLIYKIKDIKINPLLQLIGAVVIIVFPIMFAGGIKNNTTATTMQKQNNISGYRQYLAKAISCDPFSAKYKGDYINSVLSQGPNKITQDDIKTITKYAKSIEKEGEHNSDIATKLASFYLNIGDYNKGVNYLNKMVELKPFVPATWDQKITTLYDLGTMFKNNKDSKTAEKYFSDILNITKEVKEVSQRSRIPFVLMPDSMEIIEKVQLLQDKVSKSSESISSKSIFYALNDIDIDENGIPDEWNDTNTDDLKLGIVDNKLTAEVPNGKQGVLQSRKINIKPDKTYVISVEFENDSEITGDVVINLSGESQPIKLTKVGSTYVAQISTASGQAIEPISIGLVVNGKYVIKDFRVVEK